MGVNIWLLKKFKTINKDRMKKHLDVIEESSGKSRTYIMFDMFRNFLSRGSGYTDYFRGNYINATKEEKDTFVTAKSFRQIIHYLNDSRYTEILNNKLIFNKYYKEYLKRDYINLRKSNKEDFKKFLKGKDVVFAKVLFGEGGQGISKIIVKEEKDTDKLFDKLIKNKQFLVEDGIKQCKEVNDMNPNVVASFRIITLYKDGIVYLVNNSFRINQDKTNVIGCTNDLYFSLGEDGKINSNVIDDYGTVYETHPLTGKKFKDVVIPGVKEAFEMCKDAALDLPECRYIGWDVAFSEKGPLIVEGNEYPGFGLIQHYKLHDSKTGHKKEIADILGDEMKNIKI